MSSEPIPAASALGGSLRRGKMLSDDPYLSTQPIAFLNRLLYVPDIVGGRLVETPAQIAAQVDRFLGGPTPGHLSPSTAFTLGYDFLSDGAQAVSDGIGASGSLVVDLPAAGG